MFFITFDNKQHKTDEYNDNINYGRLKDLTGYSVEELAKIEFAFETNTKISFVNYFNSTEEQIMEDQFNGLMAVMDVMIELDDVKEGEKYKETFKNKFIHEY
jgi:N-acetylglutamate synthase/N-acetylornithine aminotransferase